MNMAAPSVAMTIGADVSSTRMAAEGKSADAGKTFAASLDERIAADEDATAKSSVELKAPQTQTGMQTSMSGVGKDAGHEPAAAMKLLQAPDDAAQEMSMLPAKSPTASSPSLQKPGAGAAGGKAPVTKAPIAAAAQAMQADSTADGLASGEQLHEPDGADAKPLAGAVAAPGTAADGSGKQAQSAETQPSDEILQIAQDGVSAAAASAGANAQSVRPLQKSAPAGSEKGVSTDSGESAASTKGTAKKHVTTKAEASTKTVEAGAGIGMVPGAIHGAAGMVVVAANPVASSCATDATAQTAVQTASKQGPAVAVSAGAQALTAGGHQSAASSSPSEKAHGDGVEVSNAAETGTHVVQKDTPTPAKTGEPSVVAAPAQSVTQAVTQTVKSSTKVQTAGAGTVVSHSGGVAGATASAAGANTVLQAPVAVAQKGTSGDGAATLLAAHGGNGELTSASGAQAAMNETHRTLVATPTVLEVGIPNGTQGWLKVRAELTGGGVNASLSAASSAGQEMLHRELPALTTYLQQEKVAVNSLVVQTPVAGGFRGPGGGAGGFTGGQTQQQNQGGSGRENFAAADRAGLADSGVSGTDELPAALQYAGGGWLSVRA